MVRAAVMRARGRHRQRAGVRADGSSSGGAILLVRGAVGRIEAAAGQPGREAPPEVVDTADALASGRPGRGSAPAPG